MEINIVLTGEDAERLFAIRDLQERHDLTVGDFAKELLTRELKRLFPPVPKYNEDEELINADRYMG